MLATILRALVRCIQCSPGRVKNRTGRGLWVSDRDKGSVNLPDLPRDTQRTPMWLVPYIPARPPTIRVSVQGQRCHHRHTCRTSCPSHQQCSLPCLLHAHGRSVVVTPARKHSDPRSCIEKSKHMTQRWRMNDWSASDLRGMSMIRPANSRLAFVVCKGSGRGSERDPTRRVKEGPRRVVRRIQRHRTPRLLWQTWPFDFGFLRRPSERTHQQGGLVTLWLDGSCESRDWRTAEQKKKFQGSFLT